MALRYKPGGITKGIRILKKPDVVTVIVGPKPELAIYERGDTRVLPISRKVAEVLIANGMNYGS